MVYFSCLFWLSLFLQAFQYWTPIQVAVQLLPQQAASFLVGNPLTYRSLLRVPVTAVLLGSALLQLGGAIFLVFLRRESSYFSVVFPSLVLGSLGIELAWSISSVSRLHACQWLRSTLDEADASRSNMLSTLSLRRSAPWELFSYGVRFRHPRRSLSPSCLLSPSQPQPLPAPQSIRLSPP